MNLNFLNENSEFVKSMNAISKSQFYTELTPDLGYQHKIGHIQKLMLFSQIIGQGEKMNRNQMNILLTSAAFHDCGRKKDRDNEEHGILSAKIAGDYLINNTSNYGIKNEDILIIQVAIEYHVKKDSVQGKVDNKIIMDLCSKYNVSENLDLKSIAEISAILKDADALDRARFSSYGNSKISLNPKLLRTKTAKEKEIMYLANELNQIYAGCILRKNYPNCTITENDNAKNLQYLRYEYKISHNGERKIEKEISAKGAIEIFKYCLQRVNEKENLRFEIK